MSKKQVSSETPKARARRKAREAQEAREHFGLGLDQLHVAQILACETVRLLSDMVALGGLRWQAGQPACQAGERRLHRDPPRERLHGYREVQRRG